MISPDVGHGLCSQRLSHLTPSPRSTFHWGLLYFFDMCKISENEKLSELGFKVEVHLNLNSFSVLCASHEFEQTLGDSDGPGSLTCCSPWGRKESDTTERLNNNK